MATQTDSELREMLLKNVKKEVKHIMEEAVTKKFVHEESGSITALCGAVETCLQHGLRKRALGLFKNSSTSALLTKVSKTCEPAAQVVKRISEMDNNGENGRKSSEAPSNGMSSGSVYLGGRKYNTKYLWIRIALVEKQLARIVEYLVQNSRMRKFVNRAYFYNLQSFDVAPEKPRRFRIALMGQESAKYYEKEALISDPVEGAIFASLLFGPCALDYTRMKTPDHYWTDPPADELVQRHRIHSSGNHHVPAVHSDSPKRPGLQSHKSSSLQQSDCGGGGGTVDSANSARSVPQAKEYVESLHQNNKSTLLYGKNNVVIQPKEDIEALAGYLSLHQNPEGLTIKWTPNQLMNGCSEEDDPSIDRRPLYARYSSVGAHRHRTKLLHHKILFWDYAVTIYMEEIVYLHCHQQSNSGGTVVLVGQDGVQRPPIHFPRGGHLLAFLSCLEAGLVPLGGQLDPPLWSQHGKGKVFPRLRKKIGGAVADSLVSFVTSVTDDSRILAPVQQFSESMNGTSMTPPIGGEHDETSVGIGPSLEDENEARDYVFRILMTSKPDCLPTDVAESGSRSVRSIDRSISRESRPAKDVGLTDGQIQDDIVHASLQLQTLVPQTTAVKQLCETMKYQILSRAFYGWLSHCRHLKTVRIHLSGLVNVTIISTDVPSSASKGLTTNAWRQFTQSGVVTETAEINRLVYYGGCSHEIRKEVWLYLLGHYEYGSTAVERTEYDDSIRQQYEATVSEWLAAEAIVLQRDKETGLVNGGGGGGGGGVGGGTAVGDVGLVKTKSSSESVDGHIPFVRKDSSLSNDVFESLDGVTPPMDVELCVNRPETVMEETSPLETPSQECSRPVTAQVNGGTTLIDEKKINGYNNNEIGHIGSTFIGGNAGSTAFCRKSAGSSPDEGIGPSHHNSDSTRPMESDSDHSATNQQFEGKGNTGKRHITITNPSVDLGNAEDLGIMVNGYTDGWNIRGGGLGTMLEETGLSASRESLACPSVLSSPVSNTSNGGIYSTELLDNVALNIHRVDKDVHRCDRNNPYFTRANLDKLRNVVCTYVWENLEVGYIQGMCDLVAPLLVIFDDEAKAYSCFCQLMKRMSSNFPQGGAMDLHFGNMRSLIQILDPELFEHMRQNGDYTHFYFCYRWFLLDFKRELVYEDVFSVWETIWSARLISSSHFVLFIALALVEYYREIIIDNKMDFTDIIRFFNEMAERHNAKEVLHIARGLVHRLQDLIENK